MCLLLYYIILKSNLIYIMDKYIKKYLLDDDVDSDILSKELLDVDKKETTDLVINKHLNKEEIIIEIIIEEEEEDFLDEDFEYINEDSTESD